ncbi:MAG: putative metal-binding motif-containing protein, partial [Bacteroidota bacterium]
MKSKIYLWCTMLFFYSTFTYSQLYQPYSNPTIYCKLTGNGTIDAQDLYNWVPCSPAACGPGFFSVSYIWSTGATQHYTSINSAGTYCVTATDANGVTYSACTQVFDAPNPVSNPVGPVYLCAGDQVTLNMTGNYVNSGWAIRTGSTIQILNFLPSIDVNSTGSYVPCATDGNGCHNCYYNVYYGTGQVNVFGPPVFSINGPSELCESTGGGGGGGDLVQPTIELTAASFQGSISSCLWNTGETTTSILVSNPGTYSVTVNTVNGCQGTATHDVDICTWYLDADEDGWYAQEWQQTAYPGLGWTTNYGYGGIDCDDNNDYFNPGATEIPGNGIDENCNPADDADFIVWTGAVSNQWKIAGNWNPQQIP